MVYLNVLEVITLGSILHGFNINLRDLLSDLSKNVLLNKKKEKRRKNVLQCVVHKNAKVLLSILEFC